MRKKNRKHFKNKNLVTIQADCEMQKKNSENLTTSKRLGEKSGGNLSRKQNLRTDVIENGRYM